MRRFVLFFLLVALVFTFSIPTYTHPKKAEAILGVGDIVFDPTIFAKTVAQLEEMYKQYQELQNIYGAGVKGILGSYGLGDLPPLVEKVFNGTGLKEILTDELGGAIGLGGILQGGLKGILDEVGLTSSLLSSVNLEIPPGILDNLTNIGLFDPKARLSLLTGEIPDGGTANVNEEMLTKARQVLGRFDLGFLDDEKIKELFKMGFIKEDKLNDLYVAPDPPKPTEPKPPGPPCAQWDGNRCNSVESSFTQGGGPEINFPTDPGQLSIRIFIIALGIAGGIALLTIIWAGYKIIVSTGKPEAVQSAREQLIAAIVGLIFIILSVSIFQFIVIDLLHMDFIFKK